MDVFPATFAPVQIPKYLHIKIKYQMGQYVVEQHVNAMFAELSISVGQLKA